MVTVLDGSLLNYEAATSHSITIRATSADASFSTQSFTINLTDVNEAAVGAVSDNDGASNYVLENASNGTTVGITGLASDPDGTDVVTYSLDNNAGGRFTIDPNTGVVTVNGAIDREATASYNITIRATSTDTSFTTQTFTINIGDEDEFNVGAVTDNNATANSSSRTRQSEPWLASQVWLLTPMRRPTRLPTVSRTTTEVVLRSMRIPA